MPEEKNTSMVERYEWAGFLQHRPDPNRVSSLQIPDRRPFSSAGPNQKLPPSDAVDVRTDPMKTIPYDAPRPQDPSAEPSYYDVPILQKPTWKWQIAAYFFLGGLSAGAYLIGRAAERLGGRRHRKLAAVSSAVALAAILPGPPLLIWDLGDPKRFHHMLRIFKPSTPMNLGTWAITLYSGHVAFDSLRQYLNRRESRFSFRQRRTLRSLMNNSAFLAIHDAGGVPLAMIVASYTGVLLSCTSNPLWCKNPFIAPMFSAGAVATGAEAVSLTLDLFSSEDHSASQNVLMKVDSAAHAAELACMKGFTSFAGEKAEPLKHGSMKKYHSFSKAGTIAAEVLKYLPVDSSLRKPIRMTAMTLGLLAGFATRWAIVQGGHEAAGSPHLSRVVSKPDGQARASHVAAQRPVSSTPPRPFQMAAPSA